MVTEKMGPSSAYLARGQFEEIYYRGPDTIDRGFASTQTSRNEASSFQIRAMRGRIGDYVIRNDFWAPIHLYLEGNNLRYPEDIVYLAFIIKSSIVIRKNGTELGPRSDGDGVVLPAWEPFEMIVANSTQTIGMVVPKRVLLGLGIAADSRIRYLDRMGAVPMALRSLLQGILLRGGPVNEAEQATMTVVIDSILRSLYVEYHLLSAGEDDTRLTMRRKVIAHLATAFGDSHTSTDSIARSFSISTRTLHRIFANSGTSVLGELTRIRVEHAIALLEDPAFAHLSIDEVRTRVGFNTPLQLRRGVLALTGLGPNAYRRSKLTPLSP